ncbi:MAG: NAD-dependent epimerase/dehydratase family protein, partial [Ktedonobacterales bacterium]
MDTARYLVTGGAGFIGSHITEALLARGGGVRVFDNLSTGSLANLPTCPGDALTFFKADIRDLDALREAMRGVEVVYHEAAIASVQASIVDPALTLDVNVTGTQNVLLAARDAGVRRVVFASSASVYGDVAKLPAREDAPPHPLSPYAAHKLMGERLCALFTDLYRLETVCLRYFNVFGPR